MKHPKTTPPRYRGPTTWKRHTFAQIHPMPFYRDRIFVAAVMAGPLFWWGMYFHQTGSWNASGPLDHPAQFAAVALAYPVLEELFFRGWLQGTLWQTPLGRRPLHPVSLPNLITSIIFTALHFLQHPPHWALSVLGPSLLFGYFRDKYASVLPAVLLHVIYNAGYYLLFVQ